MEFTKIVNRTITLAEEADRARPAGNAASWVSFPEHPREVPEAERRLDDFLEGQPREVLDRLIGVMYAGRDRAGVRQTRRYVARQFRNKSALIDQMTGKGHWLAEYLRRGLERARRGRLDLDSAW
jgi:hypothetical protein